MKTIPPVALEIEECIDPSTASIQVLGYNVRAGILRLLVFGRQVELVDVVDVSEQIDGPTVRVAQLWEGLVFWGGLNIYLINRRSEEIARIQMPRRLEDAEYWNCSLVRADGLMLFVSESSVTAVTESFQVAWETKVFYDQVFEGLLQGRLEFEESDGGKWWISIADGSLTSDSRGAD